MAYNRLWFLGGHLAWNVGGGVVHNPGRYLILTPPGNATPSGFGQPLGTQAATAPYNTSSGTSFDAWDYSPGTSSMEGPTDTQRPSSALGRVPTGHESAGSVDATAVAAGDVPDSLEHPNPAIKPATTTMRHPVRTARSEHPGAMPQGPTHTGLDGLLSARSRLTSESARDARVLRRGYGVTRAIAKTFPCVTPVFAVILAQATPARAGTSPAEGAA